MRRGQAAERRVAGATGLRPPVLPLEAAAVVRRRRRWLDAPRSETPTDLAANPLRNRADVQQAVAVLCGVVAGYLTPGGARVRLSGPAAFHSRTAQEFEGFSRLLWGVAPLVAGGGGFALLARLQQGLVNGCDPSHPEYWGAPIDCDQRLVDYAGIAAALLLAPETFWAPLSSRQRHQIGTFLGYINTRRLRDNNWLFFRVLVNAALALNDAPFSPARLGEDLRRIDEFYRGDGWYVDGSSGMADYYGPWAMHFYGLLCARHLKDLDASQASTLIERGERFAPEFVHWFSSDGSALPYGRSLAYRFAQTAFWGALAYAGTTAIPFGVSKGIVLRHLRWWFRQPIWNEAGLLSIGYTYPNASMAEGYNSTCSPYWALKAFLPLCLDATHDFWAAEERGLPDLPPVVAQRQPEMIVCRHGSHVFALGATSRTPAQHRHAAEKYNKFCYSTRFGFSIPSAPRFLHAGAFDSMLALSAGEDYFRVRSESHDVRMFEAAVEARWSPWPDVRVTTWLVAAVPWHVRIHCIESGRALRAAEGGFALPLDADWEPRRGRVARPHRRLRAATAASAGLLSTIIDVTGTRECEVIASDPGTNLLSGRTVIPTLLSAHAPGTHWLACAVLGGDRRELRRARRGTMPRVVWRSGGFIVLDGRGDPVFAHKG